ncbi:lipopolysaccharide heptosyltransferase II [Rhizobacter sp. OV335]|uniref:lipopolysaccharide heptosyltransferase II n=1 Tax=Rhizobacter sp. OV335 TaxID=1500264 RepID=UPI000912937C|nr:lipopolysaccharide heptosyltransferase II [Rhizobacter sp. OV335]SHM50742.1 lipopolysaccharide heptosyltransferase II [Rhizobacter sp. OV335]
MTARRWQEARRILAVRLDNLGDVLMTTPALQAIRQSAPGAHLTLLASHAGTLLWPHLPAVDDVIEHDAAWMKGGGSGVRDPAAERSLVDRLARRHFDAAVIFTVCTQSALPAALACYLAGIPLRLAHSRENPYDLLTDWVPDTEVCRTGMRHEVQRQLDLVASVGFHALAHGLVFETRACDRQAVRGRLALAGIDPDRPYLVVHPGATAASRRYPAERFGEAVRAIVAQTGCQVVLTGGADERGLLAQIEHGLGPALSSQALALFGVLGLGELAALVADAAVLLCNNSGPAHLAAALGTPSVVLYALTNPQHTPWQARARVLNHDVPCRNCLKSTCPLGHHDCLRGVAAAQVADATIALLRDARGPRLAVRDVESTPAQRVAMP